MRDGDVESYDDVPGQEPAAAEKPAAVAAQALSNAAGSESAAPVNGKAQTGDAEVQAGEPESAGSARAPSSEAGTAGSLVAVGAALAGRARRRPVMSTAIALMTAAVVVAIVAIAGGFSSPTPDISAWNGTGPSPTAGGAGSVSLGMAPAAFVTSAAQRTLTKKSAAVTLTGTVGGNGRLLSMHGSGQVDLAANDASFSLTTSYSGTTITENEFLTSKDVFLQVALNGKTWNLGGHHWMEFPLAQSLATSVPLQSPAWSLQLLEQQGAQVVPTRTQNIGGLSCSEFTVTPTQQAMLSAAAQQEFSQAGLTKPQRTTALQLLRSANPPTLTIWFDTKRQLACQMDVTMPLSSDGSPPSGTSQSIEFEPVQMTFTHYGVHVHLAPPARSDAVLF